MSPKSRPPKAAKGKKGKKGKVTSTTVVVEENNGPPFGIVVLIAVVMSIPSITHFVDGTMAFDATVLRFLAALAVSWILVHLVYAVAHSFQSEETTVTKTTTIDDPFASDPTAPYRTTTPDIR